ncbi:MAG: hypothetical protein H7Y07_01960 [Pyrinomonadaceae bacterium]|nr:hypothetical protein [Sphingobacteriaceae bacterium]
MKRIFLILLFFGTSYSGFAQYGRLEPLISNDTTYMVLRTPKETLQKFSENADKGIRKIGSQIESVERQLEISRANFIANRTLSADMYNFLIKLKFLEGEGINVDYYVREILLYSATKGHLGYGGRR